jgi:peptidyl-tRNA hydrolase
MLGFGLPYEVSHMDTKIKQAIAYQSSERAYKITLIVDTVDELRALHKKYKDVCGTSLVTDAAFTVFNEPTTTCLGIGPIAEENIGDDIKSLKTFT